MLSDSTLDPVTETTTTGEEDPHGADQRGNPLGALVYSNFGANDGADNLTQVIEWSYFVGSGTFCFKVC